MLLNSTAAARDFDLMSNTHTPAPLNVSHGPVSVSALLKPTGRGSALREGEPDKPDLATYVVMCLVLFLLVLLIVFFINCQLRNSFFASMPYDRSLREARSSYKWPVWDPTWMQTVLEKRLIPNSPVWLICLYIMTVLYFCTAFSVHILFIMSRVRYVRDYFLVQCLNHD